MKAHNIPLFDDDVLEIDEVLDSIAWDLCGYRKPARRTSHRRHSTQESAAQVVPQA